MNITQTYPVPLWAILLMLAYILFLNGLFGWVVNLRYKERLQTLKQPKSESKKCADNENSKII